MNEPQLNPETFFKNACIFELSLIPVAFLLGWIADINPIKYLYITESALLNALIGTLPLCLIFVALQHLNFPAIQKIHTTLRDTLGKNLARHHWTDLFVLAMITGVSEELLFRGILQPWLEHHWGLLAGLIISSIIFGLLHALNFTYFLLVTCASLYLGLCLDYDASRNLFTPIIIHGLYDFFAFIMILRHYRSTQHTHL